MADHARISINSRSRGSSKSQSSLQKILRTISGNQQIHRRQNSLVLVNTNKEASAIEHESSSSAPSSEVIINVSEIGEPTINTDQNSMMMGFASSFNLDLNLPPPPETHQSHHQQQDYQSPAAGDGGTLQEINKCSIEECNEIIEVGPEEEEKNKRKRRFAALLEAVRIVPGDDGPTEPMDPSELTAGSSPQLRTECEEKRKRFNNAGEEEQEEEISVATAETASAEAVATPVVRTKRGRTRVLPNKYRDSVMEPMTSRWSRQDRSSSKHVPTKRRSTR